MKENYQNRLQYEKSPYLLQHASNPVDWYPWGREAFEKARTENKPVFLSIGYSTCHWCHVMERESFQDPDVAAMMNENFVSIKVDREERPDIDAQYMQVCQMLTQSGGWPLTIIMTYDKKPFFAGTYFPKEMRFGRIGMMDLIPSVKQIWETNRTEVLKTSDHITAALRESEHVTHGNRIGENELHAAFKDLAARFDRQYGGFGTAPKFPTPHNLFFLLRYWKRTGNREAIDIVEQTLQSMRRGGIYDQVGFGFHRYSTDAKWIVPHFEKMLYDQALLAIACLEAYQATSKEEYARTAREIFAYCLRDMTSTEGGFYSAEDADSEGQEGRFYLWTNEEIRQVLSLTEAELYSKVLKISKSGNIEDAASGIPAGMNIPYQAMPFYQAAMQLNMPPEQLEKELESIRKKLFAHRDRRIHPFKDDKILTDWNGLMIAALALGGRVLEEAAYVQAAKRAAGFILNKMQTADGRLLHRYREGDAALPATVNDYAFLVYGLMELYETSFDVVYLKQAIDLNNQMISHFWDSNSGGFYLAADDSEELPVRQKEIYDGAIPSGNSIAMMNLLRLGRITADTDFEDKADKMVQAFSSRINPQPSAYTQFLSSLDFALGPSREIVIAGYINSTDTREMLRAINRRFIPNKVVVFVPSDSNSPEITSIAPFAVARGDTGGKATAYVCSNFKCNLPTTSADKMLQLMEYAPGESA